jgi:Glycosyl hydrolases family 16
VGTRFPRALLSLIIAATAVLVTPPSELLSNRQLDTVDGAGVASLSMTDSWRASRTHTQRTPVSTPTPSLAAVPTQTHAAARDASAAPDATPPPRLLPPDPIGSLTESPSGQVMPAGDLPGWHMTYAQDFNGSSVPADWGAYSGEPGGDQYGWWDPSNLTVGGGELHFLGRYDSSAGRYSTAGVSFGGRDQTYGMYMVRLKGDSNPGTAISDIALLWPVANVWPPEIDFYEDSGGSRSSMSATLHPGPNGDDCCQIQHSLSLDFTQWHTIGVAWTPSSITYIVDGNIWATVTSSSLDSGAHWPAQPMEFDLQAQNLQARYPDGPTENMTVDWMVEYTPSS